MCKKYKDIQIFISTMENEPLTVGAQIRVLRAFRDAMRGGTQITDLPLLIPDVAEQLSDVSTEQVRSLLDDLYVLPTGLESGTESPPERKLKRPSRRTRSEPEERDRREEAPVSAEVSPTKRPRRSSTRRT